MKMTIDQTVDNLKQQLIDLGPPFTLLNDKWIVLTKKQFTLVNNDSDWNDGTALFRVRCPDWLFSFFLVESIEDGCRGDLEKVMKIMRSPFLNRASAQVAADALTDFIVRGINLQVYASKHVAAPDGKTTEPSKLAMPGNCRQP